MVARQLGFPSSAPQGFNKWSWSPTSKTWCAGTPCTWVHEFQRIGGPLIHYRLPESFRIWESGVLEFVFYRGPEKVWRSEVHNPRRFCVRVMPGSTWWWIGFHNLTIEHLMRQLGLRIFSSIVLYRQNFEPPTHPKSSWQLSWVGEGGVAVSTAISSSPSIQPGPLMDGGLAKTSWPLISAPETLGYRSVYKENIRDSYLFS